MHTMQNHGEWVHFVISSFGKKSGNLWHLMVSKQRQTTTTEFKPKISFQNYRKQLFSLFSCLHENNEAWPHVLIMAGIVGVR